MVVVMGCSVGGSITYLNGCGSSGGDGGGGEGGW